GSFRGRVMTWWCCPFRERKQRWKAGIGRLIGETSSTHKRDTPITWEMRGRTRFLAIPPRSSTCALFLRSRSIHATEKFSLRMFLSYPNLWKAGRLRWSKVSTITQERISPGPSLHLLPFYAVYTRVLLSEAAKSTRN